MGDADVMQGFKIIKDDDEICWAQCHNIEKVLEGLKYHDCSLIATPFGPIYKLT